MFEPIFTDGVEQCMDVVSKTFFCADLVSEADAISVDEMLEGLPGVDSSEVDHVAHTVFVAVADEQGLRLVESALRDAGFPPD